MDIYSKRLSKLQESLEKSNLDCFLINYSIDLYYFTGLKLSCADLIVSKKGAQLFVDSRYFEACQKRSPFPVVQSTSNGSLPYLEFVTSQINVHNLGFDGENLTYQKYKQIKQQLDPLKIELINQDGLLKKHRLIKDRFEIELLSKAAQLGSAGFDFVCAQLKEGITERELANELEIFWLKQGAQRVAFEPIIAFGVNSSQPHYRAGDEPLKKNAIVLIDIGVVLDGYCSDMTRTVFFGSADKELKHIYEIVEKAQKAALKLCKPKQGSFAIDQAARGLIHDAGFGSFFGHGLGHGVGLEVHELPVLRNNPSSNTELSTGMVLTIEPGIYLSGKGGVRIEDTIVITDEGYQSLTNRSTALTVI